MADLDLSGLEGPFWFGAIAFYGIGDLITTWLGFQQTGVVETNPLSAFIMDTFGFSGLILWKAAVLTAFIFAQAFVPDEWEVGIPLGLSLVGAWVVWNNLQVIQQAGQTVEAPARSALPEIVESGVGVE